MLAPALEHLVKGIVDRPEEVQVTKRDTQRGEVLEVHVHPEDLGRVIGRSGRTAQSLRTVVAALAQGRRVRVDVVDTDNAS
ncbi:RNA-binding protein [Leucobacter sp. M11]|uniref:RNA-binding protein n=1 Tax=Leucobacter sp. M11 TaxID=2993565 RepID=UPI002D7EA566|nr:RNA-binding protein [Leucobacter sp. M11]MEB4613252.1 RNA-binding protein [Leucobacter sp. M11]